MSDKTKVNPVDRATVVNPNIQQKTAVNPDLISLSVDLPIGMVLDGKYTVERRLASKTGEADLFVCKYEGKHRVVKIYRRQRAIKEEVIQVLKSIKSKYVARIYDTGTYNGLTYEVLPYYGNGSLQGRKFSYQELKTKIIPCLNEALNVLHEHDIIHKDLKPSNIMLLDDNSGVTIIDFGISSVIDEGNTVIVTKTGMTPEYSAPETFKNLFLAESDYYSLGITIYELYCGRTPYRNMSADELAKLSSIQSIPFPEDFPEDLRNLVSALTYSDLTNRNNKSNPNRRWTYKEVMAWCRGEKQPLPGSSGGVANEGTVPQYKFLGQSYNDVGKMVAALAANWVDGKKQLFRGFLSAYFKRFDAELAGYCVDAEEENQRTRNKDDIIFWELLYKLVPEGNPFFWKGREYASLEQFGSELFSKLVANDLTDKGFWDEIISNGLISKYINYLGITEKKITEAFSAIETAHKTSKDSRSQQLSYFSIAYMLCEKKVFRIDGQEFNSIERLVEYMEALISSSIDMFEEFGHSIIGADGTLNAQFEAWLIALGKRTELEKWRADLLG